MTTPQKGLITAAIALFVVAAIYEARQVAHLRDQVQTLQQQQAPLADQIRQLQRERDDATNRLAAMADSIAKSNIKSQPTPPSKPQQSASEAADAAAFEQMSRQMKEADSNFALEGILSQMKQRLNLTSEQEAAIQAILKHDSFPRLSKHKAELEASLTSDQQAAYGQFEQDTQQDKERLSASQAALDMMIHLQANVGLSPDQQDKAFPALLEYGQQKAMYERQGNASHDSYMAAEEELTRLTLSALKGILTDQQMAICQKYMEQMLQAKRFQFPSEKQ
jgi:hypothetical protein